MFVSSPSPSPSPKSVPYLPEANWISKNLLELWPIQKKNNPPKRAFLQQRPPLAARCGLNHPNVVGLHPTAELGKQNSAPEGGRFFSVRVQSLPDVLRLFL